MKSTFDKEMKDPDFKKRFEKAYMFENQHIENLRHRAESERSNWPHGMVYSSRTGKKLAALYLFLWLSPSSISAALYHFGFYGDHIKDLSSFGRFVWVAIMYPLGALGAIAVGGLFLFLLGLMLWSIFEWLFSLGYVSADELKKDEEKIVMFFRRSKKKYNVIVRKKSEEEGGGFLARICEHPNCTASGETRSKAIDNLEWDVRNLERK